MKHNAHVIAFKRVQTSKLFIDLASKLKEFPVFIKKTVH